MNIPKFTAEASFYRSGIYYQIRATGTSSRGTTVEPALRVGGVGLGCEGSCPQGQLLCRCANHCACCIGGCRCDVNGNVICDQRPLNVFDDVIGPPIFTRGGVLM